MNFMPFSQNAIEEYAETTCLLLREADGECGVEDCGLSFVDDSADYEDDA